MVLPGTTAQPRTFSERKRAEKWFGCVTHHPSPFSVLRASSSPDGAAYSPHKQRQHHRRPRVREVGARAQGVPVKATKTVEKLLEGYPQDVQAIALAARQSLRKWLPGVQESADASAPVIGYSFGPGYRGLVCTLILSKSGVKLGLVRGSELADPHGLLAGSGKVHRHIQLGAASDLRKAWVSQLVKAAHKAWKERQ
jgi:hypothetical protein